VELTEHLRAIHATYLVTSTAFDEDRGFLNRYVQDHAEELDLQYQNAKFRMYRIRPAAELSSVPESQPETQSN
jgi:hypothetical protein